jgi:hypothetical protein
MLTHTRGGEFLQALRLVHPHESPARSGSTTRVETEISLKGALLSALFKVRSAQPSSVNPGLAAGESQWGLWDWDVIELFVSCSRNSARLPYYEFQVSPLGQHFELEIFEPRKRYNRDFRSGFTRVVRRTGECEWEAELGIPLSLLGWDGDPSSVTGNAYAILGPKESRTYWSLFLGPQQKPDFHLPTLFKPLV